MKKIQNLFAASAALLTIMLFFATTGDAQKRNERQTRNTVRSLAAEIDNFQFIVSGEIRNTPADRQNSLDLSSALRNLQDSVQNFQANLDQQRENRDDVREIVNAAKRVDVLLGQAPQNGRLESNWQQVRSLINNLGANYSVTANWSQQVSTVPNRNQPGPRVSMPVVYDSGLTGTYRLDRARSENIADIMTAAKISPSDRSDLESKLEAPEEIALEIRGNAITIASTKASPISFTADGREQTENSGGRTIRTRASVTNSELKLTSVGGATDYAITFSSHDNGETLKVTRRITTDYLNESVFAESFYRKTDQVAALGIPSQATRPIDENYSTNDPTDRPGVQPSIASGRSGEFIVPDRMIVTAYLENTIDTKVSQNKDRFKLIVQTPDEFRGAIIDGYLTGVGRSGRVSGSSNVTFNFESITLRNGKRYDFAGNLQAVKDQYGKNVRVSNEGSARSDSQTKETVTRGGIGAGLGAIIGAIAGGGKGAALGAVIGGSAGAGSVVVQGREDLQLLKGSLLTIQTSSPRSRDSGVSEN
ncbi:MAG: hypothetical protein ABR535_08710 [Pyrinomonadaceae bacterium]